VSGPATAAQWLTAAAIGTGGGGLALGLLKLALDAAPCPVRQSDRPAAVAPAVPAPEARHAWPADLDETYPLIRYQPTRARHSKGPAVTWT
jgi:hypothetical protein